MNIDLSSFAASGPNLFIIMIIIIAGVSLNMAVSRALSYLHQQKYISASFFAVGKNIVRWVALILVILFALQQVGVKVSSIINTLLALAAMVAIGFIAVWSVFSNFLCSLMVIIFSPFKIGDEIEITEVVGREGLRGKVVDFNIMYTSLLENGDVPDDEKALIRIPNNIFFQKAVKRWKGDSRQSIEKHWLKKSIGS